MGKAFTCGGFAIAGPVPGKPGKYGVRCLFCGSYRCKRCRPGKVKRVRARFAEIAREHKLQRMVTLTLDPKIIPARYRGRTDRYIRELWRMMRVLLMRKFGKTLPFVGVLEFQKNGNAHLHLLVSQYIPQAWLSKAWQSIGGGKIVDIRFVDVHRVSSYLSVYLAGDKIVHTLALLPKRARIFTTARCIRLWPKKKKLGWKLWKASIESLYEATPLPDGERFTPIEDLKPFGLELFTYFESPPCRLFVGENVIAALQAAIPVWKQVSPGKPGELVKLKRKAVNR